MTIRPAAPVLHRFSDAKQTVRSAARAVQARVARAIAERGSCRLALSGGGTPRELHRCLTTESVQWPQVHVFWGDERCVAADHEASNHRMARETLLDHVAVPEGQVHRIEGELGPQEAASRYALALGSEPLDLIILGLGEDGHTASLFPGTPDLASEARRVVPTRGPAAPHERVSLSLSTLCSARTVLFLVLGARKAASMASVWSQLDSGAARLPAALVRPEGELLWFVDPAAASALATDTELDR